MRPDDIAVLRQMIKADEGLRLFPYTDTEGRLSIGYGRNLTDVGISQLEASDLLEADITRAIYDLQVAFPLVMKLDSVRQIVIANMCFNMGVARLKTFVKMWRDITVGDYAAAAEEMISSQWATQVGARATRLAASMQSGELK